MNRWQGIFHSTSYSSSATKPFVTRSIWILQLTSLGRVSSDTKTHRHAKELVEFQERNMPVLHFSASIAYSMDRNKEEALQRLQQWQLLLPFAADVPELIKEITLQGNSIQHWQCKDKNITWLYVWAWIYSFFFSHLSTPSFAPYPFLQVSFYRIMRTVST